MSIPNEDKDVFPSLERYESYELLKKILKLDYSVETLAEIISEYELGLLHKKLNGFFELNNLSVTSDFPYSPEFGEMSWDLMKRLQKNTKLK